MDNYFVVLLLSVLVFIGAFYVNTVEQRIVQIKNDLLQHEKEIKEVKEVQVELEWTKKELKQVKVDLESTRKELTEVTVELQSTRKELTQVKVDLDTTRKELKQVKVELESTRNELKQVKVEMIEKYNARREENNQTRADVNELREELKKIKNDQHIQRPGFYVTLSSHTILHQSQRIEFDQIITDVTNNYNKITGVFTAPKDGLYHFSFTMFSLGGTNDLHAEIMQNHQVIGQNYGCSNGVSATINVVISCKKGDSVYVRHMAGKRTQTIYGWRYPAFSGFLVN